MTEHCVLYMAIYIRNFNYLFLTLRPKLTYIASTNTLKPNMRETEYHLPKELTSTRQSTSCECSPDKLIVTKRPFSDMWHRNVYSDCSP